MSPAVEIVTSSDPDEEVLLVHEAEQAVELVDDQVRVDVLFNKTDAGSAERVIVGEGAFGVPPPPSLPPPPPPPQEANIKEDTTTKIFFMIFKI